MCRYTILKDSDTFYAWDKVTQTMYQQDTDAESVRIRPITLMMLSKFAPYCEVVEKTDSPPKWIHT